MFLVDILSSELGFRSETLSDFSIPLWMDAGMQNAQRLNPRTQAQKVAITTKTSASHTRYFSHRESLNGRQYRSDLGVHISSAPEAYSAQSVVSANRGESQPSSPRAPRGRDFVY